MKSSRRIRTVSLLFLVLSLGMFAATRPGIPSGRRSLAGFGIGSLQGSYASVGRAGVGESVSVGVAQFDGRGSVTRTVRVNATGADGGRVLIDLTSEGSYVVARDGTGVIEFTNTFADGSTADVSFDFVVRTSTRSRGGALASEIFAIQREPGVTASPVTESFTRQGDGDQGGDGDDDD